MTALLWRSLHFDISRPTSRAQRPSAHVHMSSRNARRWSITVSPTPAAGAGAGGGGDGGGGGGGLAPQPSTNSATARAYSAAIRSAYLAAIGLRRSFIVGVSSSPAGSHSSGSSA